jgi:hypothetical protein
MAHLAASRAGLAIAHATARQCAFAPRIDAFSPAASFIEPSSWRVFRRANAGAHVAE